MRVVLSLYMACGWFSYTTYATLDDCWRDRPRQERLARANGFVPLHWQCSPKPLPTQE